MIEDNSSGNDELKEYLTIIRDNTERSANLVRQMQYISDLERKSSELCLTPINLEDFLQKKVNEYTLQAIKKGINLTWIIQPEVHCEIQIDTDKLTRIFDNIISNSLQYTPHGGHIDIDVRMNGQKIVYKVSDTGCGFSPKDLRKATQRFYRGDEARLSEGNHSGLGLYIVKQLVEQLGGTLQIKNGEFGGACVIDVYKRQEVYRLCKDEKDDKGEAEYHSECNVYNIQNAISRILQNGERHMDCLLYTSRCV